MQNFTGSYKKSIAGIACGFSIFLFSQFSVASESTVLTANPVVASTTPPTSEINLTDNAITAAAPLDIPASVNAVKPMVTPAKTNSASQLASLVGSLVLILVLIYGLSWFVKRFSQGGFLQNPTMKIISALPLGTRERLMLVDVGGKQLLLGVTATQINTLHVFDEPIVQSEKVQSVGSDFSQKLMAILQQKNVLPENDAHKNTKL